MPFHLFIAKDTYDFSRRLAMSIPLPEGYEILETQDGSPTVAFSRFGHVENMHNFHGAWSETNYIYGEAVRTGLLEDSTKPSADFGKPLRILSVGTGLGYNEILSAALAQAFDRPIHLHSYEHNEFFRSSLRDFLESGSSPLFALYTQIITRTAQHLGKSEETLLDGLRQLWKTQSLELRKKFDLSVPPERGYHVILYDPFSAKTNPEFWTESALQCFLLDWCETPCVFSTYAATGALKRALKETGFQVQVRPGFGGKRQSFLAKRLSKGPGLEGVPASTMV